MLTGKQSHARGLSASHEHYLRAIWEVRSQRGYARLADVAREIDVAPATLSVGLKTLEGKGLVRHDDHRFLLLTESGERVAREVHHRFQVLRAFLRDVLKVEDARAEHEACLIEHDISAVTAERLVDLLRLLREDREVGPLFRERFAHYHRSCAPGADCGMCGLACLTPGPTP
jgi:DtxR family transcriptional regulator, Mn-dependent transcriptional regulator